MAGGLFILPGIVAIMALSSIYAALRQGRHRRGPVLRPQGGRARDRARSGGADRQAGAQERRHGRASPPRPSWRSSSSTCRSRSSSSRAGLIGFLGGRAGLRHVRRRRRAWRVARARTAPIVDSLLGDELPAHARPDRGAVAPGRGRLAGALARARRRAPRHARRRRTSSARSRSSSRKMAVVTFGGAYAVLAYVAQQAVENYGWLQPGEMLDGLGMAETTPGAADHGAAVRRLHGAPSATRARCRRCSPARSAACSPPG